ncbi:LOW QUALITY PROTEIN: GTP cyclohydrolase 1 feedback regulatory protein [Gopherus evgoodei]|uniref:LOW QUALITY PROTEIN: GTP cyclohydrolase 1 feedback regulatory protein n=1 Tax=Gopherus evgoodei TaxID=1825980 RepID=UPI0011CFB51B|nr:LOW QUALITY PROTEIN: GTP cyclohydrolase 1 feedback regulatory protein [Gopherus evgoodei]
MMSSAPPYGLETLAETISRVSARGLRARDFGEPMSVGQEEVGPTMVGDEHSDQHLMDYLGAIKRNVLGNHFWEYYVNDAPRIVLDKLEKYGYRVVSMTGVGQTLVWCLHKE